MRMYMYMCMKTSLFLPQSKEDDKSCSTKEAKANTEIDLQDCLKLLTKDEIDSSDKEWYCAV